MNESILSVENVTKIFYSGSVFGSSNLVAVDDVSFEMPSGEPTVVTLVGESGSGKTTIARMVLDLTRPTSGQITYQGKNLKKMSRSEYKIYRKETQAVFQDPYGTYNPFYKINHIFMVPLKKFKLYSSNDEAKKLINEALESVGLRPEQVLDKFPHQLSGGERQRLMIARCLLTKPRIIVADEPVSMLDASLRASILDIMIDLKNTFGVSYLFITHDLSVAYYLSDKIIILDEGKEVERGNPESIIKRPAHPYVQLLMSSIPIPNPKRRWAEESELGVSRVEERIIKRYGCVFYDRCPRRMQKCQREEPTRIEIEKDHEVTCHLYS